MARRRPLKIANKIIRNTVPFDIRLPSECRLQNEADKESKEIFFIHVHIPKTAGTSFNEFLETNFGKDNFERHDGRLIDFLPKLNYKIVKKFVNRDYGMKGATSHSFNALLPYDTCKKKIIAMSFLRNPVDQFISMYFHMRRMNVDCIQDRLSFDGYLQHFERKGATPMNYLRHLTGEASEAAFTYIKELFDAGRYMLFQTERTHESFRILNRRFPQYFTIVPEIHSNRSPKDQIVTDDQRKRIEAIVSQYDYKLIELSQILYDE